MKGLFLDGAIAAMRHPARSLATGLTATALCIGLAIWLHVTDREGPTT